MTQTQKVLLLTDADVFAGTERHMLDLARGLRGQGVVVSLACPFPAALEQAARQEGLPVLTIQKHGLVDRAAVRILVRLLRTGEVTIVHAHNGRTAFSAALGVQFAGRGKCVMTQHFLTPNHATQRGVRALVPRLAHHWVTRRMSRIIAVSEAVRAALLARGEAPSTKITVIPNGAAAPDGEMTKRGPETRRSLGVAEDAPLIVCTARLEREKDIATLVSAMHRVRAERPGVRCLIAGDGSQRPALEEQIRQLDLGDTVTLLGFRSDVPALLGAADVFVLPSLAEPFGLALLEAMALGKPVVAVAAGGPLEIVVDRETGLLVPPASPVALAEALGALLADPVARRRFGEQAQARFESCFTAARMAEATARIYQEISH